MQASNKFDLGNLFQPGDRVMQLRSKMPVENSGAGSTVSRRRVHGAQMVRRAVSWCRGQLISSATRPMPCSQVTRARPHPQRCCGCSAQHTTVRMRLRSARCRRATTAESSATLPECKPRLGRALGTSPVTAPLLCG